MKAMEINDIIINKSNCDWIIEQARELKALFSYNSEPMIRLNRTRALCAIQSAKDSLSELELYIKSI